VHVRVFDDEALAVGLTCGGTVHLLVNRSTGDPAAPEMSGELYRELRAALLGDEPVVLATVTYVEGAAEGRTALGPSS